MRHVRYDVAKPTRKQRAEFRCGHPSLDSWLAKQSGQSLRSRDAVTYLLMDDDRIAGYYCLSAGQVRRADATGVIAKSAPDPIPAIRMGRFAIDQQYHGQGWGADLLREALLGAVSAGTVIGARVLLVDAIDQLAVAFYRRFGFEQAPIHPRLLMCDLRVVAASMGANE